MKQKGKLTSWDDDRGFGFIEPSLGGDKVFLHIKAFRGQGARPQVGQLLVFESAKDKQGRLQATVAVPSVLLASDSRSQGKGQSKQVPKVPSRTSGHKGRKKGTSHTSAFAIVLLFLGGVMAAVALDKIPLWILVVYLLLSIVTWFIYADDKAAAKANRWRTPEDLLHVWSLAGGWPGALLARRILRHKSRKQPFRTVFWVTVLLNCAAFGWTLTDQGQRFMGQWMEWVPKERNYIRWSQPD
ncbi:DUF1294 domain-containing protein [Pseudomaricurvus sp. HS19]|uniref:DUF1294 domain-containing protein n=1 Tax=Pseudomaricurvus sp. HS19 TaxID=2692626 RepID=UPI0013700F2D|nr:DUF1294 domain-containing protein [Pseudomaricurvus sp. HS19]